MQDTARRQLRAYVVVDAVTREARYVWPPEFVLNIKNAGQTPAHKVTVRTGEITANAEPKEAAFPIRKEAEYEIPLGPGHASEHILLQEDFIPLAKSILFSDFVNGKGPTLYIAGIIEYEDAFGEKQHTKFRFAYGSVNVDSNVTFCRNGNEAT